MSTEEIIGFVSLGLALAGTYAKEQRDVAQLKAEVRALQRNEQDITRLLRDLTSSIHRVEKALVKAGLIEIE
jgi:cell division protein FtsB